jgi:hypothetical protein
MYDGAVGDSDVVVRPAQALVSTSDSTVATT